MRDDLHLSGDIWSAFMDAAPAGMAVFDHDMRYLAASRRWMKDYGLTGQTVIGRSHYEIFPDLPERWQAIHRRCLDGHTERSDADPFPRADGTLEWVRWEIRPWRRYDGEVGGLVILSELVTERVRAEQALKASEARYRAFRENLFDPFVQVDLDGRIADCNAFFRDMLGHDDDELRRLTYLDLTPAPWHAMEAAIVRDQVLGRGYSDIYEKEYRRKDGSVIPVEMRTVLLRDTAGEAVGMWAVVRDISARRAATDALAQAVHRAEIASQAKSDLLANMSHELRTPLNAVIGFSEALLSGMLGEVANARHREYLGDIKASGEHLLRLINEILDLSAIEAGRLELDDRPVAVDGMVEAVMRLLRIQAEAGGVALSASLPADLPRLRGDERRLTQVVLNLASNAVKYTPAGGRVEITAVLTPAGGLRLAVTDTGIGMTTEDIAKAMSRFGRVESGLARKHEGTGIGLPLARSLAELHGASLAVDSQPGHGTTVTVTFPTWRVLR
ncbi:PAS domain-containing sensor histidine kinase [Magnetospirillum sp. UT-4]|uniref:PAS domain-containing sensor histidine kinase n=1 Tax=Magnetospirillum sp. UT-4 TaxID=2681467 RepID=UPI001381345E|nr:PAS domain-containing sensor histidine kinase [Magnetospirillum sp. UT-4]CAA7618798.1 putative Histidine kinase [Magnetospirillum sp. UT-4]